MHKFTIFTVILSIITVAIVIDIVANGYSLSTDYIPEKENISNIIDTNIAEPPNILQTPDNTVNATPDVSYNEILALNSQSMITPDLLKLADIENGVIKNAPNKILFHQVLKLDENLTKNIKTINLFDFEEYLGTIYELHFETEEQAMQIYSDLKADSSSINNASVKETNAFGDQSFYFNQNGKTKTVFITVRIDSHIYGLEYPHKSHTIFKKLMSVMVQSN